MKRTTQPDQDLAAWCAALASVSAQDIVPPGWLRLDEVAKLLNKSESHTFKLLAAAVREGRCEQQMFRVQRSSRVLPLRHYRLK
jgi:hypothetical protein